MNEKEWKKEWKGMPLYIQNKYEPYHTLTINLLHENDYKELGKLLNQNFSEKTKSAWHPKLQRNDFKTTGYFQETYSAEYEPKYPIYIVSKSRWDSRLTAKTLEEMKVPYYIVVEEQEYNDYLRVTDPNLGGTVLILDKKFQDIYETFDDLGNTKSKGPGPARNFCWEHSKSNGFKRHWVMDDNMSGFFRLYENKRYPVHTGSIFRAAEDFVDRYKNVYVSGFNYRFFCEPYSPLAPYVKNRRIYSCLLIENDIPYRWRGRYNEDTDLSLNVLKDGHCTIQFNIFMCGKAATQTVAGGNSKEFYDNEGTDPKSQMLFDMHPDVTTKVIKWGREHHYVDYEPFRKNKLIPIEPEKKYSSVNDYGMILKK